MRRMGAFQKSREHTEDIASQISHVLCLPVPEGLCFLPLTLTMLHNEGNQQKGICRLCFRVGPNRIQTCLRREDAVAPRRLGNPSTLKGFPSLPPGRLCSWACQSLLGLGVGIRSQIRPNPAPSLPHLLRSSFIEPFLQNLG